MKTIHKVPQKEMWMPFNTSSVRNVINQSLEYILPAKPYQKGTVPFSPLFYEESEVKDLYFIKVHKTGSTTFQNIIYRYGFNHNLTFALFNCGNAMPFPNAAWPKYFYEHKEDTQYNIVLDHALFNPEAFRSYMSSRTKVVSVLRHPLKYIESSFGFQYLDRSYHLVGKKDPVDIFLKNPMAYDVSHKWKASSVTCGPVQRPSFTKNAMAYHFGYSKQFNDSAASIEHFLKHLEKEVSFVLILERFDESLVLLKRMFKWTLKDISYMPMWSLKFHGRRNYHVIRDVNTTRDIIKLHKKWAPVDYALYDHYYDKLKEVLSSQDQDFWDEVNHFKNIVKRLKSFCVTMCDKDYSHFFSQSIFDIRMELSVQREIFKATKWNEEFSVSYQECITYTMATMEYHAASKARQIPELCQTTLRKTRQRLDSRYCAKNEHVVYTFPRSILMQMLFQNKGLCQKRLNG